MFHVLFGLVSIYAAFTLLFSVTSFRERCLRAGILGSVTFLALAGTLLWLAQAHAGGRLSGSPALFLQTAAVVVLAVFTASLFMPLGRNAQALLGTRGLLRGETGRFNQKDTAFNKAHVGDFGAEAGRRRWALQSQDPMGGIYWTLVMGLRGQVEGKVNPQRAAGISPDQASRRVKEMARYLGADLVGITTVKEAFTYTEGFSYEESKLEVGPAVTHPVKLPHRYVIVLAKEMDYQRVNFTLTERNENSLGEVGKTYYDVAQIACGLAAHLRQVGYSARAHHLRNEQIFHVPHAMDAGLGEQGMFNYLITRKFGPRVRLASVTTDLELQEDRPVDIGVQDFCASCRLCEIHCPPQAISGERETVRGYEKWTQRQEKCFLFWVSGANTFACSQCLKICPWNKPNALVHRVSFLAASRSWVARRILYWLHIAFYGRGYRWTRIPLAGEAELPPETLSWKT
jgi:reductive dehalogenase